MVHGKYSSQLSHQELFHQPPAKPCNKTAFCKSVTAVITSTCLGKPYTSTRDYIKIPCHQPNHNLFEECVENFAPYQTRCRNLMSDSKWCLIIIIWGIGFLPTTSKKLPISPILVHQLLINLNIKPQALIKVNALQLCWTSIDSIKEIV